MITNNPLDTIHSNLDLFYHHYIASDYKEHVLAPHISQLASVLTRVKNNELNRVCVSMPPRFSKSSMITLAYPLWLLRHNNDLNILIITNSSDLGEKFGIKLRDYITRYSNDLGFQLSDVKHSSTHLMFNDNQGNLLKGSIKIIGAGGSITGQDADYLILDDVYNGFDDITPTLLRKKIDWFNNRIEQRIEPQTKLLILHTRWHTNDIQGYLKKHFPEDYYFVKFPALDKNGESTWSERYSTEILQKKKNQIGERLFQSLYQQEPIDLSSDFFNLDHLKYGYDLTEFDKVVRAWDIASSDPLSDGDYTAGLLMYRHGVNAIVKDLVHGQFGEKTKDIILATADGDGFGVPIGIETGVAAAGKHLFSEWKKQLKGFRVKQLQPIKSKVDRATPLQNAIYDGNVYLDIEDKTLRMLVMDELGSFPLSEHDDIVDSMAHAYNYLFQRNTRANAKFGIVNL